jgi:hypothetical protein
MSRAPARYRLVIFDPIDDPQEIRDVVCKATGMHPTDAVQWLARAPGTWPQPLEEAQVRPLLDGLFEAAIAAEAWRVDQFPELSPVRTIHRVACVDEGLRIEGLRGEPTHWIPWERVELICAGRVRSDDEFRQMNAPRWPSTVVAGIRALALLKPRPARRQSRAARVPRDPVGEVIVVRRDPRVAFRAVENQMSFAYLGDRLSSSAVENFPVFIADLCARAGSAYITPSTQSFLGRPEPSEQMFASSQSLLDYATHRLLWSWYQRDRDSQASQPRDETENPDADGLTQSDID